jgi:hypothetical protein
VRFARLRGIALVRREDLDTLPARSTEPTMIAMGASPWQALPGHAKRHIANLVGEGAVLYVRGLPQPGAGLDLAPFAQSAVTIGQERRAASYRFTRSQRLPAALAGEEAAWGVFEARGAEQLPPLAEELLMLRHVDGHERPAIFGLPYGSGYVVCDLHSEEDAGAETPIVARLALPELRHLEVGALIAADRALRADLQRLPPFNLIIDDRPVNFDHFNTAALSALLRHIEVLCPGAHIDFGWTPRQTSPSRGYLKVMKQFSAGFVWHGLWRHVDHRAISDPAADLAKGKRLVREIQRRFGVRLQPIMIFPFELSAPDQFQLLAQAGFLACVEEPRHWRSFDPQLPRYLADSLPSLANPSSGFTVLYRYPAGVLTRDRMLAMAALGLPIIAYAHPNDVGLRRFSRPGGRRGDVSHFDQVLRFALSKGLPPRSLEEIATEVREITPGRRFVRQPGHGGLIADGEESAAPEPTNDSSTGPGTGPGRPENREAGYSFSVVSVTEAVESAVAGDWDIPEFQREFVWKPSQVCALADSLWRNYPIGALLLWRVRKGADSALPLWIADGQQRLTALCLLHGALPSWLDRKPEEYRAGVRRRFDIRFHVSAQPEPGFVVADADVSGRSDPHLVPISKLITLDPGSPRGSAELERLAGELKAACPDQDTVELYWRLSRVSMMRRREVVATLVNHQQRGDMLDIFSRLNSRGMHFRRLVLKLVMEEIPAAIRGMRGRYET